MYTKLKLFTQVSWEQVEISYLYNDGLNGITYLSYDPYSHEKSQPPPNHLDKLHQI